MELKTYLRKATNSALRAVNSVLKGYKIIESRRLYEWQKYPKAQASYNQSTLPKEAKDYLQQNNSRLQDLQSRYKIFNNKVTTPWVWTDENIRADDILYFRGDNAYVWQLRGTT